MRTYNLFCAMARALDVVGDRWTLLIIRELWLSPHRFGTLSQALPAVATNLLTERLRALEAAGVVTRTGSRNALYRLTERGEALAPVMQELIRWGETEMERGPADDAHRNRWFAQAVESLVPAAAVTHALVIRLALGCSGEPADLIAVPGAGLHVVRDDSEAPVADVTVTVTGDAEALVAVIAGRGSIDRLVLEGSAAAVRELRALLKRAIELRGRNRAGLVPDPHISKP